MVTVRERDRSDLSVEVGMAEGEGIIKIACKMKKGNLCSHIFISLETLKIVLVRGTGVSTTYYNSLKA